jgi:hypothetical protein
MAQCANLFILGFKCKVVSPPHPWVIDIIEPDWLETPILTIEPNVKVVNAAKLLG